jgi:hypothetical protein
MRVSSVCAAALAVGVQVTGAHAHLTAPGVDCAARGTFDEFASTPLPCSGTLAGQDAEKARHLLALTFDAVQTGLLSTSSQAGDASSVYLFDGGDWGPMTMDLSTLPVHVNDSGIGADLSNASLTESSGAVSTPIRELETCARVLAGLAAIGLMSRWRRRT